MITVVNLGISNIGSVCKALSFLNIDYHVTDQASEILSAQKIFLPGVGGFTAGVDTMKAKKIFDPLREMALIKKVPFFGICLGMQLMFESGDEGGAREGLGLIKGRVVPLQVDRSRYPVPHMGWNDVQFSEMKMFEGLKPDSCFYFVHSFEADCQDPEARVATTSYGDHAICAAVEKGSIWCAQFHSERSQSVGLQVLKNFAGVPC
ncbi:MAG: imidazole glycerol phosphate synthase subunit HisH [Pseudobdellovibrionaceae bacterium]